MKKLIISSILLTAFLSLTSCKKEAEVEKTETETTTAAVDSTEAKQQQVNEEKEQLAKPYNEEEDAQAKINELVAKAKIEGKNVFVQAGGNWCIWCLRFNDFVQKNEELKTVVDANYLYYHLNYSTKNKNTEVFEKYAPNGKKLGYPFFFVINGEGEVTKIIGSGELESEKSYDLQKVKQMFLNNIAKK
ncbi:thioredoxin family protein [Myroides phaeus]|uniref:thioredoxin family protein n=1 Tax=Myroides phaeus TaxID=702745 RepID=UPI001303D371|nr:thioredoxin family protein [Myroides phaeus]